jgi:hypothetical protein
MSAIPIPFRCDPRHIHFYGLLMYPEYQKVWPRLASAFPLSEGKQVPRWFIARWGHARRESRVPAWESDNVGCAGWNRVICVTFRVPLRAVLYRKRPFRIGTAASGRVDVWFCSLTVQGRGMRSDTVWCGVPVVRGLGPSWHVPSVPSGVRAASDGGR